MKQILKYPLVTYKNNSVPSGKVVAVGFQYDELFAWIEQENSPKPSNSWLIVVATGITFDLPDCFHVGTAINNQLVWHVYSNSQFTADQ